MDSRGTNNRPATRLPLIVRQYMANLFLKTMSILGGNFQEDDLLIELVETYGLKRWSTIAKSLPGRIGKQCRER